MVLGLLFVGQVRGEEAAGPVLRKLILANSEAGVLAVPSDYDGPANIVVKEVPILADRELAAVVAPFIGEPISLASVNALGNAIKQFAVKRDRVVSLVVPGQPGQDIAAGVLRIAVITGTYRDISFKGNRWFSAKMLEQKLGIKAGDEISISRLDEAVNWVNNNPFRRVQVMLSPDQQVPGKTDLLIGVQERIPLRIATSLDDTGSEVIGRKHYTFMVQYANMFGLDHQATYQYITNDRSNLYHGHAFDYRIPFRWRHSLQLSVSTSRVRPTFNQGLFTQDAENLAATLRYTIPVREGDTPIEWYAMLDYKQSNNNLEYGGLQVLSNKTDVFHVVTGASVVKRDAFGAWAFGVNIHASPGNINQRNTTEALQNARYGATARYLHGDLSIQRAFSLAKEWDWVIRGFGQISSANLLGSEQLTIGGSNTVRGYEERIFAAEQGFVINNEILFPAIKRPVAWQKKPLAPLETRFLVFHDAARVSYRSPGVADVPFTPLSSVGAGVRITLPVFFSLSFDYGWQTRQIQVPQVHKQRGHVKVSLAF